MAIDPNNLSGTATLTFNDDFNSLNLWNGQSGTWNTTDSWDNLRGYYLSGNGEKQWYINSQYAQTQNIDPWTVSDGHLNLSATPTPDSVKPLLDNQPYVSGQINTFHSFSQQYGYFEISAKLPSGDGLWPAFWLLPENNSWPPEIDVMEELGNNSNAYYTTVHSNETGSHTMNGSGIDTSDLSANFHRYGVDWESDKITWYLDGKQVFQADTPADLHSPMYMIANLAVGGYWPGDPNSSTPFPATMQIDYIRAYSANPGGTTDTSVASNTTDATHTAAPAADAVQTAAPASDAAQTSTADTTHTTTDTGHATSAAPAAPATTTDPAPQTASTDGAHAAGANAHTATAAPAANAVQTDAPATGAGQTSTVDTTHTTSDTSHATNAAHAAPVTTSESATQTPATDAHAAGSTDAPAPDGHTSSASDAAAPQPASSEISPTADAHAAPSSDPAPAPVTDHPSAATPATAIADASPSGAAAETSSTSADQFDFGALLARGGCHHGHCHSEAQSNAFDHFDWAHGGAAAQTATTSDAAQTKWSAVLASLQDHADAFAQANGSHDAGAGWHHQQHHFGQHLF